MGVAAPFAGASPRLVMVTTRRPLPPARRTLAEAPSPKTESGGTERPASSPTLVTMNRRLASGSSFTSTLPAPYAAGASKASCSCCAVSEFDSPKKKQNGKFIQATVLPCRETRVSDGPAWISCTLSTGFHRFVGRLPVRTCHHGEAAEAEAIGSASTATTARTRGTRTIRFFMLVSSLLEGLGIRLVGENLIVRPPSRACVAGGACCPCWERSAFSRPA